MSTSASTCEAIESLQATLEPLSALQGEHTQLEAWVNDSCEALENLHRELAEWQNELARKQTVLDLREDALEKCQIEEDDLGTKVETWQAELALAQQETRQLKEENADHLEQLEQLERRCIELEAELKVADQRSAELAATIEAERARTAEEQAQWKEEFKGMRDLLDKQCSLLATQLKPSDQPARVVVPENSEASLRSQELRRRAQSRLAAKRQQQEQAPGKPQDQASGGPTES